MAKDIPVIERQTTYRGPSSVPDFQGAGERLAASNNFLSTIGTSVAQTASNKMAEQLGYQAGKNPHGDLALPSFTEFDQNFAKTYETQAQATLSIQATKLLDDAHVEMSKAERITPDLISKTQQQLEVGINEISKNAPSNVRVNLETQLRAQMIKQVNDYKEKMFTQDREDQKNNAINAIDINNNSILELSKTGDLQVAHEAVKNNIAMIRNAVANHFYTPEQGRQLEETAKQNYLNGRTGFEYAVNEKGGKGPEFLRNYQENKPSDMNEEQHFETGKYLIQQAQFIQSLKSQDENLKSQQMLNAIATNPTAITDTQWQTFTNSVSPLKAEQVKFHFIQALNKNKTDTTARDFLIQHYSDPDVNAISSPEIRNAAFLKQVQDTMQNSHKTNIPMRSPVPLSLEEAQIQVASHAGEEIPVFTRALKNKLMSSNPQVAFSGVQMIHALQQNGNGQALKGLNEQDWSMYSAAESILDSPDPIKAMQDAHNRIYNQDPEVEKLHKQKWQSILTKQNTAGLSNDNFALKTFGMDKEDFLNPSIGEAYGLNILGKFSNFYSISGNIEEAKKSTQRWVDQNYGDTFINGGKFKTLHPIEKYVGFTGRDGVPYIQQDIVEQFNQKMIPLKKDYDDKKVNEYWETIPVEIKNSQMTKEEQRRQLLHPYLSLAEKIETTHKFIAEDVLFKSATGQYIPKEGENLESTSEPSREHGLFFKTYDPIKIKRHMRTENGEKTDIFNVILIGNSFGKYDIAIETKDGMRNLYKEVPHLGLSTIVPRKQKIIDSFNKDHQ